MSDLRTNLIESRRLYLLRFMAEMGGSSLESGLLKAGRTAWRQASENELLSDITHLVNERCLDVEHITMANGERTLRHLTLTGRGEDAADGRERVPGVEHKPWRR